MRLLVDLQSLQGLARDRGLGRYSLELTAAVARDERVTETGILLNGGVPTDSLRHARDLVRTRIPSADIHVFDAPWPWARPSGALDVRAHSHAEYARDAFIRDLNPDAVLIASLFERPQTSVISAFPGGRPFTAVVGYDMLQFTDPSCAVPIDEQPALNHRLDSLRHADLILAISDHTAREIQTLLGEDGPPVRTIWGGPSQLPPSTLSAERRGVICAGGDSLRKNEAATIRAFALLPPDVRQGNPLTVVGRVANEVAPEFLPDLAASLGLTDQEVRILGRHVPDAELWELVSTSRLLVMPSLAEGLGMPILEAWALGTPAIASSTTSLGEIINDPEWTFDPLDTAAQSQLLHTLLTDDSALRRCIDFAERRGPFFTWDVVAQRAVTHITDHAGAIAPGTHGGASPRERLTVVVAEPEGGVTNRAESVLAALRASYDCNVTGATWQGGDGDLVIGPKPSDSERSERLIFLMDDVRQAPNIARALESSAPAVVVAALPTDGSQVLSTWPGIKDSRYLYESHGFRHGQPSTWDYLMPLAARSLGVLVVPGTPEPERPVRQRSGLVVGVQEADHLTRSIEELHACLPPKPPAGLPPLHAATAVARNRRYPRGRLFLDITALKTSPYRSGIQRVTLALARNLAALSDTPIFPVSRFPGYLAIDNDVLGELVPDRPDLRDLGNFPGRILPSPGDTLLMTEIFSHIEPWEPILSDWTSRGGRYVQVVYDLLPIRQEDFFVNARGWFEGWLSLVTRHADLLVCDSQEVARDLLAWLDENPPDRLDQPVIDWVRLGYDLNSSASFPELLRTRSRGTRRVLVVGTIEPRKGVEVVLDAAEVLHARGEDVEFVFVGRAGWALPSILERLDELHRSSRPITWIQDATDEDLRLQYLSADLLVMASRGEGFGLPIVEALAHGVPVVARDLPVFRELLGDQDGYFRLDGELPDLILRRLRSTDPIQYNPDRLVTWRRTTEDLLAAIARRREEQ